MFHGSGWWSFIAYDESKGKPSVDRNLLRRVLAYALPYWKVVTLLLLTIVLISLLELIPPLLYRDLIDNVLPNRDISRLNLLALGMVGIPLLSGLISVAQRYFSARVGEGVIFDLRQEMYAHLQRMSLRFFTHTKSGEIISRFSNDVVGAQNAITGTLPNIVTNLITLLTTLGVMLSIEWRLTVLSVVVLPLFILPARRVGNVLRRIRRQAMEYNADLSSMIGETLSINGALLVKIFGRQKSEITRFRETNRKVRDIGVRRALVGRWFFMGLGIAASLGTALIYWAGGHFVLDGAISVGTIVAFAAYLTRLYGPISALTNVQIEFATSMVSFERVFEYLDLPVEIEDQGDAVALKAVRGQIRFDNVSFSYIAGDADWSPALVTSSNGKDG
ncbi:MAG: ABC transporter ATP-binding protein, partial [Anaerolineales bacterium]